jgi:CDP-paratose 2-epimerase
MGKFSRDENAPKHVLITGGAGFIGTNLAADLLAGTDARITIFDNLSHPGTQRNLAWLRSQVQASRLRFLRGDVRSAVRILEAVRGVDEIYHLAAHCEGDAVSRAELDVNVTGTLNVLEAARCSDRRPMVFYVSTSKVYEPMGSDELKIEGQRYAPVIEVFKGISERAPANFQSPHNCSKGVADQYVLDYARFYNLPAVVLRADTIAGPRQFENRGHGWVAHLVSSVLAGYPITVYGSGLQVCDVLHVSDMVSALLAARDFRPVTAHHAYNIGGGPSHTSSVNEMITLIGHVCHRRPDVRYAPARPSDRPFYMADSSAFVAETGWRARRSLEQTVRDIAAFWHANRTYLRSIPPARDPRHSFGRAA